MWHVPYYIICIHNKLLGVIASGPQIVSETNFAVFFFIIFSDSTLRIGTIDSNSKLL